MGKRVEYRDRVAVITGAASGIGKELARQLARRGTSVVVTDIDESKAHAVADQLVAEGHSAQASVLDVRDASAFQTLVDAINTEHGRIDFMFNNAGLAIGGEIRNLTPADWNHVLDVNLRGVIHGISAVYPLMIAQGFGTIANVASVVGLVPFVGLAPYVASKHAIVGLTNVLRLEAATYGIQVNTICPGLIKTPIHESTQIRGPGHADYMNIVGSRGYHVSDCVKDILKGIERDEPTIVVTKAAKIGWWLYRALPMAFEKLPELVMKRFHKNNANR